MSSLSVRIHRHKYWSVAWMLVLRCDIGIIMKNFIRGICPLRINSSLFRLTSKFIIILRSFPELCLTLSDLVGFSQVRLDSVGLGRIWLDLVRFGWIWSELVGVCRIWLDLVAFSRIWSDLVRYSRI